jgi:hypothetical protein
MNPALLMKYLHDYAYCLKYDDVISGTKRAAAKQRQAARAQKVVNQRVYNRDQQSNNFKGNRCKHRKKMINPLKQNIPLVARQVSSFGKKWNLQLWKDSLLALSILGPVQKKIL